MRTHLGPANLSTIEYSLWEGQAHDALHSICEAIKTFNYNIAFKKKNVHGQSTNTWAQTFLQSLASDKVSTTDKYRRARAALICLGLPDDDTVLQPLHDNQHWMKGVNLPLVLGETQNPDLWIWTVGHTKGMTKDEETEWSQESEFTCHKFMLQTH
jgi:hypothetical protein